MFANENKQLGKVITKNIHIMNYEYIHVQFDLSYRPPFIRISLLSGRDLAVIFFLCVYNNYGEKGISNSIRIPTQTHMNYILFPT